MYVGNDPVNRRDSYGLYGTAECEYYNLMCAETGDWYYCYVGGTACEVFPQPDDPDPNDDYDEEGWSRCVRECLQDRDYYRFQRTCEGPSLYDIGEDHVVCFHECAFDPLNG